MAKGRKRKLPALDWLDGHPSHARPFIDAAGIEGSGSPFTPPHLPDDAVACVEVIRASMPPGVYCAADSFLLAAFGMAWTIHKAAVVAISAPGFQVVGKRGVAWLRIMNQQAAQMTALSGRLGLDPVTRQAMKLPRTREQSKFTDLLGANTSQGVVTSQ